MRQMSCVGLTLSFHDADKVLSTYGTSISDVLLLSSSPLADILLGLYREAAQLLWFECVSHAFSLPVVDPTITQSHTADFY